MTNKKLDMDGATLQLIKKVLSLPPKPHGEMKVGRAQDKKKRGTKVRASSAKRRNA